MSNTFLIKKVTRIFMLSALLFAFAAEAAVWNGTPSDVTNDNLTINGNQVMPAGGVTYLVNDNSTYNVTLSANLSVAGSAGAASQLYLCAEGSSVINFNVSSDLTFLGSADGTPLLIIVGGSGTVQFTLSDGKTVSLTSSGNSGGTQAYIRMADAKPTLRFERASNSSNDVNIVVGPKSVLSYISDQVPAGATQEACIIFHPTNSSSGRMIFCIEDTGSFVVSGHKVDNNVAKTSITLGNIDRSVITGKTAFATVLNNTSDNGGLQVLNKNKTLNKLMINPFDEGGFDGIRYGFVVSANGILDVTDKSFLDYVELGCNVCPSPSNIDNPGDQLKVRNPAALIVDGSGAMGAVPAKIWLGQHAAIFFRSGVNKNGEIENAQGTTCEFAVDPATRTPGAGNIVLAVEGQLDVCGTDTTCAPKSKLEILSLTVDPSGGPVFIDGSETNFPKRNFEQDGNSAPKCYNTAAFLVNNCMNFKNSSLVHTDVNHTVFEKDDVNSEPTYIGGETWALKNTDKPKMSFINARMFVHSDVAFTGLDLLVPEKNAAGGNVSRFVFHHNGKKIDNGTGRQMILGTNVGSFACDNCKIICKDAHLDVIQQNESPNSSVEKLKLEVAENNGCIDENISGDITDQFAVHTIYLGHASNISVGTPCPNQLYDTTLANFVIHGNYFSFETRGGPNCSPETSGITGKGGIFVDCDGKFEIHPKFRANVAAMITKSGTGQVCLPKEQVFFDSRVGISDWELDLSVDNILVSLGERISDYTLNWLATTKDFDNFCPYAVGCLDLCNCPEVEAKHIASLPTVLGTVQQFQIKGSRLGDPVHLKVDCGWVKELVFLSGNNSAEAPVGVVVLENNGRVGLGSRHRNVDSLEASITLGVNGVTIIANGNGRIDVNEDLIINNHCSILAGPDFGSVYKNTKESVEEVLQFHSDCCRTIRVKSGATLDLSSFKTRNQVVEFAGNVQLVLEPGAKIIWGGEFDNWDVPGGVLRLRDEACIIVDPVVKTESVLLSREGIQDPLTALDDIRVKFIGVGKLELAGCSCLLLNKDAYLSVETLKAEQTSIDDPCKEIDICCEIECTDLCITLTDSGQFLIGDGCQPFGGAFQVGNPDDHQQECVSKNSVMRPEVPEDESSDHKVLFKLIIDGPDACFKIGSQGFVGFGVGIVDKPCEAPNNWMVSRTHNVQKIDIQVLQGKFSHERIFSGNDARASLLSIGGTNDSVPAYSFECTAIMTDPDVTVGGNLVLSKASVLGGGNLFRTNSFTSIAPTVGTTDSSSTSILASKPLTFGVNVDNVDAQTLFDAIKTKDVSVVSNKADAARGNRNFLNIGYVDGSVIVRTPIISIMSAQGAITNAHEHAIRIGAVGLMLQGSPPGRLPMAVMELSV